MFHVWPHKRRMQENKTGGVSRPGINKKMVPKDVTYSVGWLKPIEVVGSANCGHGHGVTLGRPLVFKLAGQSFNILGDPNHYKV